MAGFDVPPHLTEAILRGRCIAFVGAGFAGSVIPSWPEMLVALGKKLNHDVRIPGDATSFDYEAIGQQLQDRTGDLVAWELLVKTVLDECRSGKDSSIVDERCRLLQSIPFKAILTTNFDGSLRGATTDPTTYWQVLRGDLGRGWQLPDDLGNPLRRPPIIKLHGEANGDPTRAPLVFARADYRRLVHGESRYANFVRAAFAQYTVLFLGVSFTDAYLNELRSEILNVLHTRDRRGDPWGYAVLVNKPRDVVEFFEQHESIHVLEAADFSGLDRWLEAIAQRTSVIGRLATLLAGKSVLWIDSNPSNNTRGAELLQRCGARVTQLVSETALDETSHARTDLLLTHFGFAVDGQPRAIRVLERMRHWQQRPPVIVFAAAAPPEILKQNRLDCLRQGAWEYTTHWSELYRHIEVLFDRLPGAR